MSDSSDNSPAVIVRDTIDKLSSCTVLDYINDAFADDETVYITYREYLTDDLSKPAYR